jgi:hypothetical protein
MKIEWQLSAAHIDSPSRKPIEGCFFLAAEPAGDTLKGLSGWLGLSLEEGTTLEEAMSPRAADE